MTFKVNIKFDRAKYEAKKKAVVKALVLTFWKYCQEAVSVPNTGIHKGKYGRIEGARTERLEAEHAAKKTKAKK